MKTTAQTTTTTPTPVVNKINKRHLFLPQAIKFIFIVGLLLTASAAQAQVGINTTTPDPSAALDIESTTAGLLIPRMLEADKNAITTPAEGLMVYQTDGTAGMYIYTSSNWELLGTSGASGEFVRTGTVVSNSTDIATDDFVFGSDQLDNATGTDDDARVFFDKSKGSFRAGIATGNQFDDANVGVNSVALGYDNIASGPGATAVGFQNTVSSNDAFAAGALNIASGIQAAAFGISNQATGSYAFAANSNNSATSSGAAAFGFNNTSSGDQSFTSGADNTASGFRSFATGRDNVANAEYAFAANHNNEATANGAAAFGFDNTAAGDRSFAAGVGNTVNGNGSFATGFENTTLGNESFAIGIQNTASSFSETVIGPWATTYTANSTTAHDGNDRVFTIGNGIDGSNRSNAMTILKNGNVGIGIETPTFPLAVQANGISDLMNFVDNTGAGIWHLRSQGANDKDLGFTETAVADNRLVLEAGGNIGINRADPDATLDINGSLKLTDGNEGAGKVLTSDAAGNASWQNASGGGEFVRTGTVVHNSTNTATDDFVFGSDQLDNDSGTNVDDKRMFFDKSKAAFRAGYAIGTQFDNSNVGIESVAFGQNNIASGTRSVAIGLDNLASSFQSAAFNGYNRATGFYSTVFGRDNFSRSYGEFVIGINSLDYTPNSTFLFNSNDRIFVIGNGADINNRSNAMTVLKNGNIGIGTATPTRGKVEIVGSANNQTVSYGFLNGSGQVGFSSNQTVSYSVYADGRIASSEFNAFSDARIKTIQGVSNKEEDLNTLSKIEITDYTKIAENDSKTYKKVIAQQVAEVFPQAVSNNLTDFVPNIYELSEINDGWITTSKTSEIVQGDTLKLVFASSEEVVTVQHISEGKINVNSDAAGQVFIYGKQVDDFHTVDYEAISMLNVSATQALLKRIEKLETELAQKESIYNQKFEAQAARLDNIEQLLNLKTLEISEEKE